MDEQVHITFSHLSISLSISLSLSLSHTHTHTQTQTPIHTLTYYYTLSLSYTHTHSAQTYTKHILEKMKQQRNIQEVSLVHIASLVILSHELAEHFLVHNFWIGFLNQNQNQDTFFEHTHTHTLGFFLLYV